MIRYLMMLFDFLKKFFGWADLKSQEQISDLKGSQKRKAPQTPVFEENFITPKKFKTNYSTTDLKEDYFDIYDDSDDSEFLNKQQFSPIKSCNKLNGTHPKRSIEPYQFQATALPTRCKPTCSSAHWNPLNMGYFSNEKHNIQDTSHNCPTLFKTNQFKERHQYEELLHNFLPRRLNIFKEKHDKETPVRNAVEVIKPDKTEMSTSRRTHQHVPKVSEISSCWHRNILNNTKMDKGKTTIPPVSGHNKRDIATCSQFSETKVGTSNISTVKPASTSSAKFITTNSLRDELSARSVMRRDFIPQLTKRYNERIEQRHKEAEELRKMTSVLSIHNRYAREAALEEQLARTMKLCLVVLDDREELEEPPLPKLTDQMLMVIKNALIPRPLDEVLVENFGLRLTRKDIHTLAGLNWLNDEVINFYMNLLIARGTTGKYPKVHAMNTFFYPKLISSGHASLKRWTRKVDIFAQDIVVVPIHLGIHWCMSIINFKDKSILYYDSMGGNNPKCLLALKQYLQEESLDKKKQIYDTSNWTLQSATNIPQQMNGSDCGVFSCMFAEYISANKKITFTQENMPYFRNKMVYEILKVKLL